MERWYIESCSARFSTTMSSSTFNLLHSEVVNSSYSLASYETQILPELSELYWYHIFSSLRVPQSCRIFLTHKLFAIGPFERMKKGCRLRTIDVFVRHLSSLKYVKGDYFFHGRKFSRSGYADSCGIKSFRSRKYKTFAYYCNQSNGHS